MAIESQCLERSIHMPRLNPDQVRNEVLSILEVWKANCQFQLADLDVSGLERLFSEFDDLVRKENSMDTELSNVQMNLEAKTATIREACIRARAGMQGYFGRNSNQYSLAGGTRLQDRRSPKRIQSGNATPATGTVSNSSAQ
jgi:hypothetical protein